MLRFWDSLPILVRVIIFLTILFTGLLVILVAFFRACIGLDKSLDPGHYKRDHWRQR